MKNGNMVSAFEHAFAKYVGAEYAIALCNGTATLHTALKALGWRGRVSVPPLTMSATTMAVLHAGLTPRFVDIDQDSWIMDANEANSLGVSLYGLSPRGGPIAWEIDDAAQTLRKHNPASKFTSYSFQHSKILPLGEGGMLATNDERLAKEARQFSSLGYLMSAGQPCIDPETLKSPFVDRHHSLGWNYRMNDMTAEIGVQKLRAANVLKAMREFAAGFYMDAIQGCSWIHPQYVPHGWTHDYWCYAVATHNAAQQQFVARSMAELGAERPYSAWRLTYQEPAFKYLICPPHEEQSTIVNEGKGFDSAEIGDPCAPRMWSKVRRDAAQAVDDTLGRRPGICGNAEALQPCLLQFQTNDVNSARTNAEALKRTIEEYDSH